MPLQRNLQEPSSEIQGGEQRLDTPDQVCPGIGLPSRSRNMAQKHASQIPSFSRLHSTPVRPWAESSNNKEQNATQNVDEAQLHRYPLQSP